MRCLVVVAALAGVACAGSGVPTQGPLVHRFEHADHWTKELDGPERDVWQKPTSVIDAMKIRPGMVVADIGAGTGYFESWLSRAVGAEGTVLALDIEPDMVRHLRERGEREHWSNVKPAVVTTDDPRLPDGKVDRILIVDTWHHIASREKYAAKLRVALTADGAIFIVDFKLDAAHGPPKQHRVAPEDVARELTSAGLVAEIVDAGLPEQYVVTARPSK